MLDLRPILAVLPRIDTDGSTTRCVVLEDADTRSQADGRPEYQSQDGHWCVADVSLMESAEMCRDCYKFVTARLDGLKAAMRADETHLNQGLILGIP